MLNQTRTICSSCPYCGEQITLVADCSVVHQVYVEDCEVCCRPITIEAITDRQGEITLILRDENS
ncbi:MAG: CPXCG motif-containing cysteine-rich protein [Gammaproteobacteria bacterium]|nr:CPXCG motif-containing cysteine-rich protein [Gammaproteobacteria bacterium]